MKKPWLALCLVGLGALAVAVSQRSAKAPAALDQTPGTSRPHIGATIDVVRRVPQGMTINVVPNTVVETETIQVATPAVERTRGRLRARYEPLPKKGVRDKASQSTRGPGYEPTPYMLEQALARGQRSLPRAPEGAGPVMTFDSLDQDDALGIFPPDTIGAAGPDHVVNVINSNFAFHDKLTGAIDSTDFLFNLFAAAQTFTFDPKVVYDPYHDRFVIITLEAFSGPVTSRVLVGVSDNSDPNGVWHQTQINTLLTIGGIETFNDYPSLAVDEQAIYITTNQFGTGGQGFRDSRIFVIAKGAGTGGLYDGGAASTKVVDPPDTFGVNANFTLQPADILGTPPGGLTGTFLAAYNALSDGVDEYLHVFQLNNPVGVGAATLVEDIPILGDIDAFGYLDAPQPVLAVGIDIVGPRVYDAVWQGNVLTATTVVVPPAGPSGETTAHWVQVDTTNLTTTGAVLVDQGEIDGEDIAPNTFTFMPAVAQAADGTLGFGFSASGTGLYPGSYYTHRKAGDAAGTVRPSRLLRRGTGRYEQTDPRNRWGDYSGIGVDPDPNVGPAGGGQCFWAYNEHSTNPLPSGPGEWGTAWIQFCPDLAECGNSNIEQGETCDPPGGSCRASCTSCGDGTLDASETCDPPGPACRADCTSCGDSIIQASAGEECDDGNAVLGDGCDGGCLAEVCGNGLVQFGETCDPPGLPAGQPEECRGNCLYCGDGVVQGPSLELLDNGDFEFGTLFGWSATAADSGNFSLSVPGSATPQSGLSTAPNASGGAVYAVSDEIGPGTHALAQGFTVPSNATAVGLSFEMFVNNWNASTIVDPIGLDHTGPANQHGRVDLMNPGFPPFDTTPAGVVNNYYLGADPIAGVNAYTAYSINITTDVVPGQSYEIRFADTGNQYFLNLGVDNVRVTATIPPPEACDDANNLDGDGCSSACESGCGTGVNTFTQTILATDSSTLAWAFPIAIDYVEGSLASLPTYGFDASGSIPAATSVTWSVNPAPGTGRYLLVKVDCPASTWTSGGPGECPGAICDRDGSLPP